VRDFGEVPPARAAQLQLHGGFDDKPGSWRGGYHTDWQAGTPKSRPGSLLIMAAVKIVCSARTEYGGCLENLYDAGSAMARLLAMAEYAGWQRTSDGGWLCPQHALH
jgi:hypothetical protein